VIEMDRARSGADGKHSIRISGRDKSWALHKWINSIHVKKKMNQAEPQNTKHCSSC